MVLPEGRTDNRKDQMKVRAKWYLEDVKKKQNRSWSTKQKIQVLTLCLTHTAKEVAEKLGTSVTVINNVKRLAKLGLSGRCFHCGDELTEKEKAARKNKFSIPCDACKEKMQEYKKQRRERALKSGLCGYCEKKPVLPGKTACKSCLSSTQRRRNKMGLCGTCGKRPLIQPEGAVCHVCSKKMTEQHRVAA